MSLLKLRSKVSAIGFDVDAHEFRAVQLIDHGQGHDVLSWAIFPRRDQSAEHPSAQPDVSELAWAHDILARRGFVNDTVSLMVSPTQCSAHVLELPPVESGAPIDQLARAEVARAKKCGPNDFELGYWSMPPKGRSGPETLAVACPGNVVQELIERYEQGRFDPVGIDIPELVIPRTGSFDQAVGNAEINASIHIGWASSLAVLMLGETVIYARKIDHGAEGVWEIATNRFQLSRNGAQAILDGRILENGQDGFARMHRSAWSFLATNIASELDVAVGYVSHSHRMAPLGKIVISGYGYNNAVIEEIVEKTIGMPYEYAAPDALIESMGSSGDVFAQAARLSVAYGLAARFDS